MALYGWQAGSYCSSLDLAPLEPGAVLQKTAFAQVPLPQPLARWAGKFSAQPNSESTAQVLSEPLFDLCPL